MTRSLPEWTGTSDDAAIPPRVRVRVFDRCNGRCCWCRGIIAPGTKWECDHIIALANGGEHREGNLALMCGPCHRLKTLTLDLPRKAKIARTRRKHLGIKHKRPSFATNKDGRWKKRIDGTVVSRSKR